MKNIRLVLKSVALTFIGLPILGLVVPVVLLSGKMPQTASAGSSSSGFTTIDAPGAGTTANRLQGTTVVSINDAGQITGFETDSNSAHHGFVRAADGTITEFDPTGAGTGYGQGTMALSIDAGGDAAGAYIDSSSVYHGFVRTADGTITNFDVSGERVETRERIHSALMRPVKSPATIPTAAALRMALCALQVAM
jgi:hypothetical protein